MAHIPKYVVPYSQNGCCTSNIPHNFLTPVLVSVQADIVQIFGRRGQKHSGVEVRSLTVVVVVVVEDPGRIWERAYRRHQDEENC